MDRGLPVCISVSKVVRNNSTRSRGRSSRSCVFTQPPSSIRNEITKTSLETSCCLIGFTFGPGPSVDGGDSSHVVRPHTNTGSVSNISVLPTTATKEDDKAWGRTVQWAASDFGLCSCPIFHVDILSICKTVDSKDNLELGSL